MSEADPRAELEALRERITEVDRMLVDAIAERLRIARRIGELKADLGLPVMDPAREAEVVRRAASEARERGADPELVRAVLWRIIDHARAVQDRRSTPGRDPDGD